MKPRSLACAALFCALLAACSVSDTTMENGAITLNNGIVTLHVSGSPDAVFNANGDLQIADKVVTLNTAQRGLLVLYYQSVHDVNQTGREIGKVGAKMGGKALKNKLEGKSQTDQGQDAKAGGNQMQQLEQKICQDRANIKAVQDQLSAQLVEFKPYGSIMTQDAVTSCEHDD
jgi:hypothetical protein